MTAKSLPRRARRAAAMAATLMLACSMVAWSPLAHAAEGLSMAGKVTETVTVVSFDAQTRHLTVKTASGHAETMKVPEEFQNVGNLKPGDRIKATYQMEAELALSPPNKPLPEDTQTVLATRAAKGELPAGAIANHIVVTGAVLAVDNAKHTVKLVNPKGGEVHTIYVASTEGRALMRKLKPGDKITADVTESLLISTSRG